MLLHVIFLCTAGIQVCICICEHWLYSGYGFLSYAYKNLGAAKAKELLMLGHRFTGEQAADWGIITAAAAPEDLEEMVMKTAKKLAKGPALAYERMKRLVNRQLYQGLEDAMKNEGEYQYQLCKSEDHAEAIHAFF